MDKKENGVKVAMPPVVARVEAPTPGIVITVHMWITWAELAIEHERESLEARQHLMDAHAAGEGVAEALGRETAESLIAVCSAAFAMEALLVAWARLVMDAATVAKWESSAGRRRGMTARTGEVLKRAVKDTMIAQSLKGRWDIVFTRRGNAVHFGEAPGVPVPHPAAGIGNVASIHLEYSEETATEAVGLLMETLHEIDSARRPEMQGWIDAMSPAIEQLQAKRQNTSASA